MTDFFTGVSRVNWTGSLSAESASTMLCSGSDAEADTLTFMVKVAESPAARELFRLHLTTPLLSVIAAGRLQLELRYLAPLGSVSFMVTLVAADEPLLVSTTEYAKVLPAVAWLVSRQICNVG
jgi:hypothetical protein